MSSMAMHIMDDIRSKRMVEICQNLLDKSLPLQNRITEFNSLKMQMQMNPLTYEKVFEEAAGVSPFHAMLDVLAEVDDKQMFECVVDLLVQIVANVGITLDHARGLISMLSKRGHWPKFAITVLEAMTSMVTRDGRAGSASAAGAAEGSISDQRIDLPYFILDGTGGIFLGHETAWPFDTGYSFETWVWMPLPHTSGNYTAHTPSSHHHLFRIIADESDCGASNGPSSSLTSGLVAVDICLELAGKMLSISTIHAKGRTSCAFPLLAPPPEDPGTIPSSQRQQLEDHHDHECRHSSHTHQHLLHRWVHIAVSHTRSSLLPFRSEVDVWVNGRRSSRPLPYPSRHNTVRIYVGCAGWKGLTVPSSLPTKEVNAAAAAAGGGGRGGGLVGSKPMALLRQPALRSSAEIQAAAAAAAAVASGHVVQPFHGRMRAVRVFRGTLAAGEVEWLMHHPCAAAEDAERGPPASAAAAGEVEDEAAGGGGRTGSSGSGHRHGLRREASFWAHPRSVRPLFVTQWSGGGGACAEAGAEAGCGRGRGAMPGGEASVVPPAGQGGLPLAPPVGRLALTAGAVSDGERMHFSAALDCLGQVDALVSLLIASYSMPIGPPAPPPHPQPGCWKGATEPANIAPAEADAVSPSKDGVCSGTCKDGVCSGTWACEEDGECEEGPTADGIAAAVLRLMSAVLRRSEAAWALLLAKGPHYRCLPPGGVAACTDDAADGDGGDVIGMNAGANAGTGGARMVGAVTHGLLQMPPACLTPAVLVALLSVIDAFTAVEKAAPNPGAAAARLMRRHSNVSASAGELRVQAVAGWLLHRGIWLTRASPDVAILVVKEVRNLAERDAALLSRACGGVDGLLNVLRDCWMAFKGPAFGLQVRGKDGRDSSFVSLIGRSPKSFKITPRECLTASNGVRESTRAVRMSEEQMADVAARLLEATEILMAGNFHPSVALNFSHDLSGLAFFVISNSAVELREFGLELLLKCMSRFSKLTVHDSKESRFGPHGRNIIESWLRILIFIATESTYDHPKGSPSDITEGEIQKAESTAQISRIKVLALAALAGIFSQTDASIEAAFAACGGFQALARALYIGIFPEHEYEVYVILRGLMLHSVQLAASSSSQERGRALGHVLSRSERGHVLYVSMFCPDASSGEGEDMDLAHRNSEGLNVHVLEVLLSYVADGCVSPLLRQQTLIDIILLLDRCVENRSKLMEVQHWASYVLDTIYKSDRDGGCRNGRWTSLPSVVSWLNHRVSLGQPRISVCGVLGAGSDQFSALHIIGVKMFKMMASHSQYLKGGWRALLHILSALSCWKCPDLPNQDGNGCSLISDSLTGTTIIICAVYDAIFDTIKLIFRYCDHWDGNIEFQGRAISMQTVRDNLGGMLVVTYAFLADEENNSGYDLSDRKLLFERIDKLLALVLMTLDINGSPPKGALGKSAFCQESGSPTRSAFGPSLWRRALWSICVLRLLDEHCPETSIRTCAALLADACTGTGKDLGSDECYNTAKSSIDILVAIAKSKRESDVLCYDSVRPHADKVPGSESDLAGCLAEAALDLATRTKTFRSFSGYAQKQRKVLAKENWLNLFDTDNWKSASVGVDVTDGNELLFNAIAEGKAIWWQASVSCCNRTRTLPGNSESAKAFLVDAHDVRSELCKQESKRRILQSDLVSWQSFSSNQSWLRLREHQIHYLSAWPRMRDSDDPDEKSLYQGWEHDAIETGSRLRRRLKRNVNYKRHVSCSRSQAATPRDRPVQEGYVLPPNLSPSDLSRKVEASHDSESPVWTSDSNPRIENTPALNSPTSKCSRQEGCQGDVNSIGGSVVAVHIPDDAQGLTSPRDTTAGGNCFTSIASASNDGTVGLTVQNLASEGLKTSVEESMQQAQCQDLDIVDFVSVRQVLSSDIDGITKRRARKLSIEIPRLTLQGGHSSGSAYNDMACFGGFTAAPELSDVSGRSRRDIRRSSSVTDILLSIQDVDSARSRSNCQNTIRRASSLGGTFSAACEPNPTASRPHSPGQTNCSSSIKNIVLSTDDDSPGASRSNTPSPVKRSPLARYTSDSDQGMNSPVSRSFSLINDISDTVPSTSRVPSSPNRAAAAGEPFQDLCGRPSADDLGEGIEIGRMSENTFTAEVVTAGSVVRGMLETGGSLLRFLRSAATREEKFSAWEVAKISEIHGRRYLLRASALELFFLDGSSLFLNFPSQNDRHGPAVARMAYRRLVSLAGPSQLRCNYLADPARVMQKLRLTEDWVQRRISNFEYLMQLNSFAGRTYHDLDQYFVLPWVLRDYTSDQLDLKDPASYRDLSRPIGAQTETRRERYRDRFDSWCGDGGSDEVPAFHYGSHYSSAGYVLWYLLRLEPYTTLALELQDGRFDCPDRMFWSIADAYEGCAGAHTGMNDVKELIPEFFYLPDFLVNANDLDLGHPQQNDHGVDIAESHAAECSDVHPQPNGSSPDDAIASNDPTDSHRRAAAAAKARGDVALPPWTRGSAAEFVRIQRQALESEYVSANLHHWIDLIFGYKQRGPAATEAVNVYYYLTYEGTVDLDAIQDPGMRAATEAQIRNFGQTPRQIFNRPHPPRRMGAEVSPATFHPRTDLHGDVVSSQTNSQLPIAGTSPSRSPIAASTMQLLPAVPTDSFRNLNKSEAREGYGLHSADSSEESSSVDGWSVASMGQGDVSPLALSSTTMAAPPAADFPIPSSAKSATGAPSPVAALTASRFSKAGSRRRSVLTMLWPSTSSNASANGVDGTSTRQSSSRSVQAGHMNLKSPTGESGSDDGSNHGSHHGYGEVAAGAGEVATGDLSPVATSTASHPSKAASRRRSVLTMLWSSAPTTPSANGPDGILTLQSSSKSILEGHSNPKLLMGESGFDDGSRHGCGDIGPLPLGRIFGDLTRHKIFHATTTIGDECAVSPTAASTVSGSTNSSRNPSPSPRACHGSNEHQSRGSGIVWVTASGEYVFAVRDDGALLCWSWDSTYPPDRLALSFVPVSLTSSSSAVATISVVNSSASGSPNLTPAPTSEREGTRKRLARKMKGFAASVGGILGGVSARRSEEEDMQSGCNYVLVGSTRMNDGHFNMKVCGGSEWHWRFGLLERGESRILISAGHPGGTVHCYLIGADGAVSRVQVAELHRDIVSCLCIVGEWQDRRGRYLITGGADATIRIWYLGTWAAPAPRRLSVRRRSSVSSKLAASESTNRPSPEGHKSAGERWALRPLPRRAQATLTGHTGPVSCVAADLALDVVVSGGADGRCLIYSLSRGELLRDLCKCTPHTRHLGLNGASKQNAKEKLPGTAPKLGVTAVALTCNGEVMWFCRSHGRLRAADINGNVTEQPQPQNANAAKDDGDANSGADVCAILLSPDGAVAFTSSGSDSALTVLSSRTLVSAGPLLPNRPGASRGVQGVRGLALSGCGNFIFAACADGGLDVYAAGLPSDQVPSYVPACRPVLLPSSADLLHGMQGPSLLGFLRRKRAERLEGRRRRAESVGALIAAAPAGGPLAQGSSQPGPAAATSPRQGQVSPLALSPRPSP